MRGASVICTPERAGAGHGLREGRVAGALRAAGDALEVEVCDDGPWLAPGEAERVFDKF